MKNSTKYFTEEPFSRKHYWGVVGSFILLLCFSSLGLLTSQQWQAYNKSDHYLSVSLVSTSAADYSVKRPAGLVALVNVSIIRDIVRENQSDPANKLSRLAAVDVMLKSPMPKDPSRTSFVTPRPETHLPVATNSGLSPTQTPVPTVTPSPTPIFKATITPTPIATGQAKSEKTKKPNSNNSDKSNKSNNSDKSNKSNNSNNSGNSNNSNHSNNSGKPDNSNSSNNSNNSDKSNKSNKK